MNSDIVKYQKNFLEQVQRAIYGQVLMLGFFSFLTVGDMKTIQMAGQINKRSSSSDKKHQKGYFIISAKKIRK